MKTANNLERLFDEAFMKKDHCQSPVLTTPTSHCFRRNLKFVNVNYVSQLINSLSQLFTLRPRWLKVPQIILFSRQATLAVSFITLVRAIKDVVKSIRIGVSC